MLEGFYKWRLFWLTSQLKKCKLRVNYPGDLPVNKWSSEEITIVVEKMIEAAGNTVALVIMTRKKFWKNGLVYFTDVMFVESNVSGMVNIRYILDTSYISLKECLYSLTRNRKYIIFFCVCVCLQIYLWMCNKAGNITVFWCHVKDSAARNLI